MAAPTTTEIATLPGDPYVPQFQGALSPTDETLAQRGGAKGHHLYDEIRRDPHAHAVLQKRKLEVIAREWDVTPASDSRLDKKAAAEVKKQLKALNFDRVSAGLLGAVLKGFAVAEVIWAQVDGIWTVTTIKVKKQRRFRFMPDGELRMLTRTDLMNGVAVPERKFIVHRYSVDDDDDDPYGVGLGSVLFWPAWFKRQALAHWLRSNEKNAGPTKHAKYPGAYDKARSDQLVADLSGATSDSVIVTPENVSVELLESARAGGADAHESMNRYLDELMSEATLGETLSTNSGERGARSLGEIHNEVRIAIAKTDSDLLSLTFKESVVRWIVEVNYPGAGIPDIWRDFEEPDDLDAKMKRDETLEGLGYEPEDEEYYSETYGGAWVKKQPAEPDDTETPALPGQAPKATDALFAEEQPSDSDKVAEALAGQLEELAAPSMEAMIAASREQVMAATSYEDLIERLAHLAGEFGIEDLADVIEQAGTVAALQGVSAVKDEA